jgi:molecular chaperone GrpE (heat shock protein)
MHSIDIGKLIFEPDSIGQIENQLSDILQKKIILNRQKLEHYRQTSLKQIQELKKYGIEITENIEFSFYEKQLLEI